MKKHASKKPAEKASKARLISTSEHWKDFAVSMEFLLVTFKESRTVLADGDPVGVTNHILIIPANEYDITLSGDNYVPPMQSVTVMGTSVMHPIVVAFA